MKTRSWKNIFSLHDKYGKKAFFWFLLGILFFILLFYSQSSQHLYAQSPLKEKQPSCTSTIQHIQLAKETAQHNIPKTGWQSINQLPYYWDTLWPNYHGTVWYKIIWDYRCQDQIKKPVSLSISNINMAGALYHNNEFIWQDLSLKEPLSRSWHQPRLWILNTSNLNEGQNTLLVKVVGTKTQQSGLGHLFIGEHYQILKHHKLQILEKQTLPIINIIINVVIGFLCLMVWIFIPQDSAFKWFSVVSFLWVIYSGSVILNWDFFDLNSIAIDKFSILIFCIYTTAGCLAAWRFARKKYVWIERILITFNLTVFVLIMTISDDNIRQVLDISFMIAVIIFLLKCISYPYIAYKTKIKESYILAFQ